jgi:hypothetical protein
MKYNLINYFYCNYPNDYKSAKFMEIHSLDNGKIAKLKDTEFILGLMVIGMKVSGRNALEMVMVLIFLQMEISIQVNIKMENLKVLECINGQMEIRTKVSLRME